MVPAANFLETQIENEVDCNSPTITFAYVQGTIIGLYAGRKIESSASTLLKQLSAQNDDQGISDSLVLQICGPDRDGDHTTGLIVDTKEDFSFVQHAMQSWNNATCVTGFDAVSDSTLEIVERPPTEPTGLDERSLILEARANATCSYIQVVSGDSCGSLVTKCGITAAEFTTYNPSPTLCSSLAVGEYVCCSAGSLPDFTPKPNADGTCANYTVQAGDYCSLIASNNFITTALIEEYNNQTWGWQGCGNVQLGQEICLSSGKKSES